MRLIKKIYENVSTCINVITLKFHKVVYGKNICIRGNIFIKNNTNRQGAISIGKNVVINSSIRANPVSGIRTKLYAMINGSIDIGNNVGLSNCTIISNNKIIIEDNVLVGAGTIIIDTDFHSSIYKERIEHILIENDQSSIKICEGAFVGANCIILKGVIIGKESVIGAGSVVTKTIPDNEIWAGNPARFIRKNA